MLIREEPATPSDQPVIPVMRPWLGAEEAQAAADAVLSGWVAQGPRVAAFEAAMSDRMLGRPSVATSSCTTGLHLALVSLGVGSGQEVVVPSLSFIATANVVRHVGAIPRFADVDAGTLNVTPDSVAAAITKSTKAVIVVDQAGTPADVEGIMRVCRPLGVDVIEDAACALGSTLGGQPAGTASDYAVFSFHPRKIITCGEGGMLSVADRSTAERLRRLREHGMSVSAAERHASSSVLVESYLETGYNFRMTDIQAAVGLVQLRKLEDIIARRRHLALRYQEALGGAGLITASDPQGGTTNFQSFWVMLPDGIDRKVVLNALAAEGISCRRGIMAAHREPAYTSKRHQALPVTDRVTTRSIILPLYHALQEHSQDRVISSLLGLLEGGR